MTPQEIARVCYEANSAYCVILGDAVLSWEQCEKSAVAGVEYFLNNPLCNPIDQHDAWSKDKIADGWVYGPVKDAKAKTHPCLVAYHELPEEQRRKDALFQAVIKALI